ncbi:MAG: sensor histidine kinase [Enterocloster sp.]
MNIKITMTDNHLIIMVSDDGIGMEKEQVKSMNETLRGLRLEEVQTASSRGGIAVRNVNNRIKLLLEKNMGSIFTASREQVQMWRLHCQ